MEFYIGRSSSWDAKTYPRVGEWPLSVEEEAALMKRYASLLIAAYATFESWKRCIRGLDDGCEMVGLDAGELPDKIYVVLGAHPEKITWPGEWAPYRLNINVAKCLTHEVYPRPAFVSAKEAQDYAQKCLIAEPKSRFTVVELTVVN